MDGSITERTRMEKKLEEENKRFLAIPSTCLWQKTKDKGCVKCD